MFIFVAEVIICLSGDECSQSDQRRRVWVPAMRQMVELVYIDHTFLSCIQNNAFDTMPKTMLLLHVHIFGRGHHLLVFW
jgi:hypothetical protein